VPNKFHGHVHHCGAKEVHEGLWQERIKKAVRTFRLFCLQSINGAAFWRSIHTGL
jgi:hypothetical protein